MYVFVGRSFYEQTELEFGFWATVMTDLTCIITPKIITAEQRAPQLAPLLLASFW